MRSNGLATILLMIPVLAVPALAIFGIPQFAPDVASPLDEGQGNDRDSRIGTSVRPPQDELFGDFEGFNSEPQSNNDSNIGRRDSAFSRAKQKAGSRRSKDLDRQEKSVAAETDSDWADDSPRRLPSNDAAWTDDEESPARNRNPKTSLAVEGSPSGRSRQSQPKRDDAIRLASATESDLVGSQTGFSDEPKTNSSRPLESEIRPKQNEYRSPKRRKASAESLTWKAAVERLNALDVRDFRIEQGHELGQFVFICSYTPPNTPRVSYRFEAEADEPLKAIEKVLDQIVDRQQRR